MKNDIQKQCNRNRSFRWKPVVLILLLMVFFGACNKKPFHEHTNQEVHSSTRIIMDTIQGMEAPKMKLDEDGVFSLEECPTSFEGFEMIVHNPDEYPIRTIDLKKDGHIIYTWHFNDSTQFDGTDWQFLDANFDGYVDIHFGSTTARNYTALYLWDNDKQIFVRATDDGDIRFNGFYYFQPSKKLVFTTLPGSAFSGITRRMSWNGTNLCSEEELHYEMLKYRLGGDQPSHYVVWDPKNQKIIFNTNDVSKLPERWREWAYVPSEEERIQNAKIDAEFMTDEE